MPGCGRVTVVEGLDFCADAVQVCFLRELHFAVSYLLLYQLGCVLHWSGESPPPCCCD